MRALALVSLGLVLGLGCTGPGADPNFDEGVDAAEPEAVSPEPVEGAMSPPAPVAGRWNARPSERMDRRWTSTHYNLTIAADDPAAVVGTLRDALSESGALIQNANWQADNGYLNASLDDQAYLAYAAALSKLDPQILNESTSVNELGPQLRQLRDRMDLLASAERAIDASMRQAAPGEARGLMLLRELAERERQNLDSQLTSYESQVGRTFVYVNVQRRP